MNTVRFLVTTKDGRVHITPLGVTFSAPVESWSRITSKDEAEGLQELTIPQFMQLAAEANK